MSSDPFYIDRDKLQRLAQSCECAIWLSNSDAELRPDIVRLLGSRIDPAEQTISVFAPLNISAGILRNLHQNQQLSYMMASLATLESFQIKGTYISHETCSEEEVAFQQAYIDGFIAFANRLGFDASPSYGIYFHQPSIKITLSIGEIYEQTPRNGTGKKLEL
ncbi:MAG: hypothetical protein V4616_06165 [Bacteroidota bacterium]